MIAILSRGLAATAALAVVCATGAASADTLKLSVGDRLARADLLQPGTHRYVRYVRKGADRNVVDVWVRTVAFETHDGARALHMTQRWNEADKALLIQDSWFEPGTLRPTSHLRHVERDGKTQIAGYQWAADKVVGQPDLPDNTRKDFVMPLSEPAYNFEYDLETLQALPMAPGRVFDIPFYDAGIDKPGRYLFKVAGEGIVAGPDGKPIDCWLITADYNTGAVVSRWWFAKRGQLMVREEGQMKDGSVMVKALLPPEAGDDAPRKT